MDRSDETLIPAHTWWLQDKDVRSVCAALGAESASVYFVGGCVRDALLGRASADVDLATDVEPAEVTRLVEAAGLKAVPTGIDHGTVTVVAGGRGFEVTTFRQDVATDGRRATVAFSKDITADARRRDFTLNALYATPGGEVIDPLGSGLADCRAREIRFIEDAATRIREDYLRVLRFFRFHAWYAAKDAGFDPDALSAIAANLDGLETLSAERVGSEMMRLLAAPQPTRAVAGLMQTGALGRLLPGADISLLGPLINSESVTGIDPMPITRLASLGGEDPVRRFRLSRNESRALEGVQTAAWGSDALSAIAYRQGADVAVAAGLLRASLAGTLPPPDLARGMENAASLRFPVTAKDLMPAYEGPALGARLRKLEDLWIAADFKPSRDDLMKAP